MLFLPNNFFEKQPPAGFDSSWRLYPRVVSTLRFPFLCINLLLDYPRALYFRIADQFQLDLAIIQRNARS